MKNRLQEIIRYKTGGRQTVFAQKLGWTPQYLTKLLKGENFGLQPVMKILETFPEIDARWLLFGTGEMLPTNQLRIDVFRHVNALLEVERYIPVMSPADIHEIELVLQGRRTPVFSPDTLSRWREGISARDSDINVKINRAISKSDELCKVKIVKK